MAYTNEELNYIYDKNNGYCWHCEKKLSFKNYGIIGARGAWEVDHSNPLSKGGTDYFRNLVPSCISCNRSKGNLTSEVSPHWLRHTFGTNGARKNVRLESLQSWMGHTDPKTTLRYIHAEDEEKRREYHKIYG